MSKDRCYHLVYLGKRDVIVICFSEDLFRGFLHDPAYFDRFSFFNRGNWACQLRGEIRQRAEGLLEELLELSNTKLDTSMDLTKVVMLQLLITIEEAKRSILAPGSY
ncbi:MAG TPA: hypothetical protein VL727_21535 [Puia sp.]|nr:hypothetical protein [Puia sp.]